MHVPREQKNKYEIQKPERCEFGYTTIMYHINSTQQNNIFIFRITDIKLLLKIYCVNSLLVRLLAFLFIVDTVMSLLKMAGYLLTETY
jgi:hypothetical protein